MICVMHRTTRVALVIISFQTACLAGVIAGLVSGGTRARACRSSLGDGYIEFHCQGELPGARERQAETILTANEPMLPSLARETLARLPAAPPADATARRGPNQ
jgi:hypothetical protein